MTLNWFDAREAAEVGAALADEFARQTISAPAIGGENAVPRELHDGLQDLFERADREVRTLQLNFYKKAKFANAFKWRLLENGVSSAIADDVTQRLVLYISVNQAGPAIDDAANAPPPDRPVVTSGKSLLALGNKCVAQGAYDDAIGLFRDLIKLDPRNAMAHNNLGAALCKLGGYREAESHFRAATRIKPDFPDAHSNLGTLLRWRGLLIESESSLRRAIKLHPRHVDARTNLGVTLGFLSRLREARGHFEKAMKFAPRNADALCGMAFVDKTEGRFEEATALLKRALAINPKMPNAWAALAGLRKMTSSDAAWIEGAEEIVAGGIPPLDEAELRFAMGKYCDDVGNLKRAFENFERANELLKGISEGYDRGARTQFVDDLIRLYPRETAPKVPAGAGPSSSMKPVFVVGLPRSGTSLVEQIIASHPAAKGAGELEFWNDVIRERGSEMREGRLGESARKDLAEAYLRVLEGRIGDASRIVDKSPVNSDYLGLIHSVFPNARIVYVQRDPIDTCLSCYFHQFSLALNFTVDLSDLAHYCGEHQRLMAHWRAVLPPGTILDVPYAQLVEDQEVWTRKIVDFLGLDWSEQCLNFHETNRAVVTNSFWQVRQRLYKDSVARWRHYERFIGPLLKLKSDI